MPLDATRDPRGVGKADLHFQPRHSLLPRTGCKVRVTLGHLDAGVS